MARVLIVQNAAAEGPGHLQQWLPAAGLDLHQIHPYLGHRVPRLVEGDALIVLGGPMSAYDGGWIPAVRDLLATAVEDGVPTLGICLGAQLLALACGGTVASPGGNGPEIGMDTVEVAAGDTLLSPGRLPVVQWHYDAVSELPGTAVRCATGARYPNQAFRVGESAWGLQFHVEATPGMVAAWAAADREELAALGVSPEQVVAEVQHAEAELEAAGEPIVRRFAALVTG